MHVFGQNWISSVVCRVVCVVFGLNLINLVGVVLVCVGLHVQTYLVCVGCSMFTEQVITPVS